MSSLRRADYVLVLRQEGGAAVGPRSNRVVVCGPLGRWLGCTGGVRTAMPAPGGEAGEVVLMLTLFSECVVVPQHERTGAWQGLASAATAEARRARGPNQSIERTATSALRALASAAHLQR